MAMTWEKKKKEVRRETWQVTQRVQIHIEGKFRLVALELSMGMTGFFPWKDTYINLSIPAACSREVKIWAMIWLSTPKITAENEAQKGAHLKSWWAILASMFPSFLRLHDCSIYTVLIKFI